MHHARHPGQPARSAHLGTPTPVELIAAFTIANSNYPNHSVQTRALHAYLYWRNANTRHRDVLAAERRERARIRSEKGVRRGSRPALAA